MLRHTGEWRNGEKTRALRSLFFSLAGAVGLGLAGCAGFWDDVTSRDFNVQAFFQKPNPFLVLKESNDGDLRAKALRALQEPKQHGGTDADQEAVVQILVTASAGERQALCRLAAIQTLSQFKDPRAVKGLEDAYFRANNFPPETATVIRCQALAALGETRRPDAANLLIKVVQEPRAEGADQDQRMVMDERIAAARALSHFNQRPAAQALVKVLQTEKDVALRDRVHESLQVATGKEFPPDPAAWDQYLRQASDKDFGEEKGSKIKLLSFFEWD